MRYSSVYYFYSYTVAPIIELKKQTNLKICYRNNLTFLKYKNSLTNSFSNRIVYQSNYLRAYKNVREYYTSLLRANFLDHIGLKYIPYHFLHNSYLKNNKFLLVYFQQHAVKDFDFLLYWRGNQINSLFNLKTTVKKKRKKRYYKHVVYYIKPNKRILFVWKWLSVFIRCLYVKGVPKKLTLIPGFENFFMVQTPNHIISNFKFQIYKLKLLRVV